jgi:carbonic anhydrase/acetyltransferase-like protein (isoleucine patch superfamily)
MRLLLISWAISCLISYQSRRGASAQASGRGGRPRPGRIEAVLHGIEDKVPGIGPSAWIARNAEITGDVTIGHSAVHHACTISTDCLISMRTVVLVGTGIDAESNMDAGALVTQGRKRPQRSLVLGSPARFVRQVDAALEEVRKDVRLPRTAAKDHGEA